MAYYPKIKILRKESGKSKREIVNYLGTKKKYYNLYENGTGEIAFTRAIALAKYYNVSLDYIAGLTNDKRGLTHSNLTREQRELLDIADKLSASGKKEFIELLRAMINAVI